MLKRLLAMAAIAVVALAVPAAAQTYVGDNTFTQTGDTLSARCFLGTVQFFDQNGTQLGSAEAANGTATFQLPPGTSTQSVQARGTGCDGGALVLDVTIARTPTAPGALPRTGTDSSMALGQLGAVLLAAGGVTVFVTRRRQLAKAER
jgi:LPXTG-motif cell wall-anchored protein